MHYAASEVVFQQESHIYFYLQMYGTCNYLWPMENEGVLFKNHTLDEYRNEVKETPVKYSVFV